MNQDKTTSAPSAGAPPVPAAEANGQLIVSLTIVVILGLMGLGLIVSGVITREWGVLGGGIGTVIGALANALTAPTGIGNVLRATGAAADAPKG